MVLKHFLKQPAENPLWKAEGLTPFVNICVNKLTDNYSGGQEIVTDGVIF
jgi:hypothetical protein